VLCSSDKGEELKEQKLRRRKGKDEREGLEGSMPRNTQAYISTAVYDTR
jgi:hypothetical protein